MSLPNLPPGLLWVTPSLRILRMGTSRNQPLPDQQEMGKTWDKKRWVYRQTPPSLGSGWEVKDGCLGPECIPLFLPSCKPGWRQVIGCGSREQHMLHEIRPTGILSSGKIPLCSPAHISVSNVTARSLHPLHSLDPGSPHSISVATETTNRHGM